MYSFGKIPPRAIQASGVASVLGEDCRVFYDHLFTSAGLGRVSDLLSARLKAIHLDELKLRAVLLFGFFEAYRAQNVDGALDEPLVVECGMDDEKVAVGVAFSLNHADNFKIEGLSDDSLLRMIHLNSDHTIVRVNLAQKRVEVISLLAIPGKLELSEKQPITVIEQGADILSNLADSVKAKEYVQLADLEYSDLLKEDSQRPKKKTAFSTGEILSKRFSASNEGTSKATVKGSTDEDSSEVRISKGAETEKDEVVRISGGSSGDAKKTLIRVSSGTASGAADEDLERVPGFSVQEILKKVWPFKRKKQAQSSDETDSEFDSVEGVQASVSVQKSESEIDSENDPTVIAQHLSQNFATGSFSQFVERTQEMAQTIKRESQDQAAKRWADGLSQQIMAEKVRLGALSQKINQAIRQKEQDLKKREQQFAEDLRRKEEALRQKNAALNRAKEQVAQLTAQLEKQKNTKSTNTEDAALKHKYQLSQRMILSMREENAKLLAKMEDVKSQSTSSQKAAESSAQIELANLKSKQDQMTRQNMQLKSLNEQLMRRMNQGSAKSSEKSDRAAVEEMKKKYEAASKLSEQQQKDMAQLKGKLDKLSKEETRWIADLAKKDADLRKMKAELEQLQSQAKSEKKAG